MLAAHPKDTGVLTLAASYFASQGELARARELLEQALAVQPGDTAASLAMARLELTQGDSDGAEARVRDVLKATPNQLAALGLPANIPVPTRAPRATHQAEGFALPVQ